MAKLSIKDLALSGKRVVMRVDFNVPMKERLNKSRYLLIPRLYLNLPKKLARTSFLSIQTGWYNHEQPAHSCRRSYNPVCAGSRRHICRPDVSPWPARRTETDQVFPRTRCRGAKSFVEA